MNIKFIVQGKAVAKQRPQARRKYANQKYISMYTPKPTVEYEKAVAYAFLEELQKQNIDMNESGYAFDGALEMNVVVNRQLLKSFSKKKQELALNGEIKPTTKPDIDNILKSICDGLNEIAYKDDAQITKISITKKFNLTSYVEIELKTL